MHRTSIPKRKFPKILILKNTAKGRHPDPELGEGEGPLYLQLPLPLLLLLPVAS
jgi:hypothetical protein